MTRLAGLIAVTMLSACASAGCARDTGLAPSHLGLSDLAAKADTAPLAEATETETSSSIDHVASNKVLGAMAFQKVTGRSVSPERLTNRP